MERSGKVPLLVIDVAGGSILTVCALASVWLIAVRPDGAKGEIAEYTRLIQAAEEDLSSLQAGCDRQRRILASKRAELAEHGRLPDQTPVEEYSRMLSELAARHRLRVISQKPLSSRQYPGLLEQRFAYEVTGSLAELVHFFEAIEHAEFWADIGYLKIQSSRSVPGQTPTDRVATLTLSLFSALPKNGPAGDG